MGKSLLEAVVGSKNLFAAWEKVKANGGMAGTDGQGIKAFGHNVFGRLLTLKQQVEKGEYRPQPLKELHLAKPDGGVRRLAVPAVRDRVLQTATARVLTPILEREFEAPSYGYRAGRSVKMAVARVAAYRDQGFQWVVDADIQTFFDQVDHPTLLQKLRRTLSDESLMPLIELWLSAVVQPADDNGQPYLLTKGVPQGSPLSPLLANLYLDDFDEAIIDNNMRLVRFADDFLILCRKREEAERALNLTADLLEGLKLQLKREKTRITNFEEGFRFLGVDFLQNLLRPADPDAGAWLVPTEDEQTPPPLPDTPFERAAPQGDDWAEPDSQSEEASLYLEENPALEPMLRSLVVARHGRTLLKEGRRISVVHEGTVEASVPLGKLDQVLLSGNQLVSTALFRAATEQGISFTFADAAGRHLASVVPTTAPNVQLWRSQVAREREAQFGRMLATAMVRAKIHNSRGVLRRYNRRRQLELVSHTIRYLGDLTAKLSTTTEMERLRGLEGAAARAYFRALRDLLPEHWGFTARRRQPPTDPFNVLLSYGYGVLAATLRTLLERRGLNPWFGHLHTTNGRHPALVADLMEEFRAPIVDSVALSALLNNLEPEDFILNDDNALPCRMTERTRKRYLEWLQNKFRSVLQHPTTGQRVDYHRLLQAQVHHYADVILDKQPLYLAYHAR